MASVLREAFKDLRWSAASQKDAYSTCIQMCIDQLLYQLILLNSSLSPLLCVYL